MIVLWLSELITTYGLGNGASDVNQIIISIAKKNSNRIALVVSIM